MKKIKVEKKRQLYAVFDASKKEKEKENSNSSATILLLGWGLRVNEYFLYVKNSNYGMLSGLYFKFIKKIIFYVLDFGF